MFRQSPRKNQRSGGMKTKHVLQIGLVLGVFIWLFVHGSDKKESSQQNTKFSEKKIQQYGNDKDIKLGRKDLKPRRDAYSEDEKPMDVLPQGRSQFDDETKPKDSVEEQVNYMGKVEHIENYANNLKETEGGVAKKGKDGEMGEQENNLGMNELKENLANNMEETETEEGGVAKEGKDGEMGTLESNMEVEDGRGNENENENQSSDDQKMDGGTKDVTDTEGGDNFNNIDDQKFEEENNEHDAGKYDGEGQQKMEAVNVSEEDTNGETTVDNDGKRNEFGETIDGNGVKEGKSEGTLEENGNGHSKIADTAENENKLVNELGELMKVNQNNESTNNVIKEENKGEGKVSENSQKSAGDEVSIDQKVGGNTSENSHKSGGDEQSIEHKLAQESDGIKGEGDEERIEKNTKGIKEQVKNNKVAKQEDVLNEKTSLPEGKIIDTSDKSSKSIQENNPDAEVASAVIVMTSNNGTEIEKGSSSEPEKTKNRKKKAKNKNSNQTETLTTGNENEVPHDEQQHMLASTEKLNTNDEKSNLSSAVPSTKVKVEVENGDSMGSNDVESVAAEEQNAEPKTSQATADISGMEERWNAEPKITQIMADGSDVKERQKAEPQTSQIMADKSGTEERQNAEPKTFQDKVDRSGATQGQKKSSINDSDERLKSGTDTKVDGEIASFNDDIGTNASQIRMEKPSDLSSSSVNNLDVSHKSTDDTTPDENLASVSDSDASTQSRIKSLSHVSSFSNAEETETLSRDTSSSNGDENAEETSKKTAEDTPNNESDSSSGSLLQEEKEAGINLDTLPESGTSSNDASE